METQNDRNLLDRGLPCDEDAEAATLGAILLDNALMSEALDGLSLDSFYLDSNRKIWRAMTALAEGGKPIELLTLTGALNDAGEMEQVGGFTKIGSLVDGRARTDSMAYYIGRLREKSNLRRMIRFCRLTEARAMDQEPSEEILTDAQRKLLEMSERTDSGGLVKFSDVADGVMEQIEILQAAKSDRTQVTGIPSGLLDLDALTCGFQKQNLVIIAAATSRGKTTLALNIAHQAAQGGALVAFFSLEMSAEELVARSLGTEAKLDSNRMRAANLLTSEWSDLQQGLRRIHGFGAWVDDSGGIRPAQIQTRCQRLALQVGRVDLIIVDYLQLLNGQGFGRSREQEVSAIAKELKAVAKAMKCPVIALSQLSRAHEVEKREPNLHDLRESGAIEQDADVVLFIHKPAKKKPSDPDSDIVRLLLKKQRNGPTGRIFVRFDKKYLQFQNASQDQDEDTGQGKFI
jgi:replicative DNA helicase